MLQFWQAASSHPSGHLQLNLDGPSELQQPPFRFVIIYKDPKLQVKDTMRCSNFLS